MNSITYFAALMGIVGGFALCLGKKKANKFLQTVNHPLQDSPEIFNVNVHTLKILSSFQSSVTVALKQEMGMWGLGGFIFFGFLI